MIPEFGEGNLSVGAIGLWAVGYTCRVNAAMPRSSVSFISGNAGILPASSIALVEFRSLWNWPVEDFSKTHSTLKLFENYDL